MSELDLLRKDGVQTSLAFGFYDRSMDSKHRRVGVDMGKSDMLAIVCLLIDKGIINEKEYREYLRLAANREVAFREAEVAKQTGKSFTFC